MDQLDHTLPETIPLSVVSKRLGTTNAALMKAARRGEFCEILVVTARNARVRMDDLRAWIAGRWVNPETHATRVAWVKAALRGPQNPAPVVVARRPGAPT